MRRLVLAPRPDWVEELRRLGGELAVDTSSPSWREDAAYEFTGAEIVELHDATEEVERLVRLAIEEVVRADRFAALGIEPELARMAAESWRRQEPSLYGRYDLRYDGQGPPKLLEYNADTPTSLFEAAVVQWHWHEATGHGRDQFNAIHEALVAAWGELRRSLSLTRVHLACMPADDDDLLTTAYLLDTAVQAGLDADLLAVPEIGWNGRHFLDLEGRRIEALFKLYPWDWLVREPFFAHIEQSGVRFIEPAWRVIPASKGILAVLDELFPGHANLLPASFHTDRIRQPRVLKPLFGREGANIVIDEEAGRQCFAGPYADMATVAQAFAPLPELGDGYRPVIGSWVVAGKPVGLGIREERSLVTSRLARYVPHIIA